MNIPQLTALVAVVDEGSFSAAARVLGISQPAVTMQIRSLEEELGVTLFDRRHRRLDLTDAGKELVSRSRTILAQIDEAREEISSVSGVVSGPLVVASSTTPGDYIIPKHLGSFLEQYPHVDISISIMNSEEVIRCVENGSVDLGVSGSKDNSRVTFTPFDSDELVVIAHPKSKVSKSSSLGELKKEAWIMRKQGSGTQTVVKEALERAGLKVAALNSVVELGAGEAIVSAVEGGLGVAMVSAHVAEKALKLKTVVKVPLKKPVVRPFYSVAPKGTPTRAALAFQEHLQNIQL